jgi:serine/threonine-protein kinase
MDASSADRDAIRRQLDRVLASPLFRRAERSSALLRYIVEHGLEGHSDRLKEYTLGAEALGRGESFDPRTDPVVRAEASRLRTRLEQYYETTGKADPILIILPKGSYVPTFSPRTSSIELASPEPAGAERPPGWFGPRARLRAAAAVALILALATWVLTRPRSAATPPLAQFDIELKSDGVLGSDVGTDVVLSPDGHRVVFVSRTSGGRTHLNTRRLDQSSATGLPGTDGARGPFVSPDGRWVGFWADGRLKKTSVDGGSPVILCDAVDVLGASWGEDDTIVMASDPAGKLWRIPATGGVPRVVVDLTAESASPRWPQVLPGGDLVLYTALDGAGADRATIEVHSLRHGQRKTLVHGGTFGRYLSSGHLTYVNQGTLYAVKFDLDRLVLEGAPVPMLEDVSYSRLFGYAQVDASRTGVLVYRKGGDSGLSVVDWIDRAGRKAPLLTEPGRYSWPRLSDDGRRLAITSAQSGAGTILVHDVETGETTRTTRQPGDYTGPTWLTTRDFLVFGSAAGMGWVRSDRPSDPTALTDVRAVQVPWSVAPDGRRLAYYERNADSGFDLWTVPLTTSDRGVTIGTPEPFLRTPVFEVYPSFSADGRWITYASNESGAWEVYVRRFPDDGTKVRVSTSGGVVPRWSRNGRELLYRTDQQQVLFVGYRVQDGSFVPDTPRPWSSHLLADTGVLPNFDVAPDGERILALTAVTRPEARQTPNHVTLMLNFSDELRRRAAGR